MIRDDKDKDKETKEWDSDEVKDTIITGSKKPEEQEKED